MTDDPVTPATAKGRIAVTADGARHLVDYAGVRLLSEASDGWDTALVGGSWGAWVEFAQAILAVEESGPPDA